MLRRIRRLPSPALVISAIALVLAVGGGTFAIAALSHHDKKVVKKIANKQITKRAPGLSVNHATSADNGVFAFGQIREDGSIKDSSSQLLSVTHTAASGIYCLTFKSPPPIIELEGSVVSEAGTDPPPTLVPRVTNGQGSDCTDATQLKVRVQNTSGTLTDGRFSFIVP